MKKLLLPICIIFIFNYNCNTTDPPPDNSRLTLTVEDVNCTESWLKLETENLDLPAQINLYADDKLKSNYAISTKDTILYIDSLLPNKNYTIKAQASGIQNLTSSIQLTTLDTTSHNITWEVETVGDYGSYALDVAVIDENDIWIVGQFYERFGSDTVYNAAHWNGNIWELVAIPITNFGGFIYPTRLTVFKLFQIMIFGFFLMPEAMQDLRKFMEQ